jgi:hypothetical protein
LKIGFRKDRNPSPSLLVYITAQLDPTNPNWSTTIIRIAYFSYCLISLSPYLLLLVQVALTVTGALASFTPAALGGYRFELVVDNGVYPSTPPEPSRVMAFRPAYRVRPALARPLRKLGLTANAAQL